MQTLHKVFYSLVKVNILSVDPTISTISTISTTKDNNLSLLSRAGVSQETVSIPSVNPTMSTIFTIFKLSPTLLTKKASMLQILPQTLASLTTLPELTTHRITVIANNLAFYNKNPKAFNEYLAGVIDGDGYFRILSGKYPRLAIEVGIIDTPLLIAIQNYVGGKIYHLGNRPTLVKYQIADRSTMIKLVHLVNGHIRNTVRVPQFIKVCEALDIQYIPALPLTVHNAYWSGFFDADGCISASFTSKRSGIQISCVQKYVGNLSEWKSTFNGGLVLQKSTLGSWYSWQIASKKDVITMLNQFTDYPLLSHKTARISMIEEFQTLHAQKAHKVNSPLNIQWVALELRWKEEFK